MTEPLLRRWEKGEELGEELGGITVVYPVTLDSGHYLGHSVVQPEYSYLLCYAVKGKQAVYGRSVWKGAGKSIRSQRRSRAVILHSVLRGGEN